MRARAVPVFVYRVKYHAQPIERRETAQAEACGSEHRNGKCSSGNRPLLPRRIRDSLQASDPIAVRRLVGRYDNSCAELLEFFQFLATLIDERGFGVLFEFRCPFGENRIAVSPTASFQLVGGNP